jgi:AAA+ ATPase superfamily predicted ATPase
MDNIIGRQKEIRELNQVYESGKAEFVAVYGRRRVGKTFLIDECLKGKITFRHAGLSPVDKENNKNNLRNQLKHFYFSLLQHGMKKSHCPSSWMEAFFLLSQFLESRDNGQRKVVFLDELPWMDTPRSGFITAIEGFWNTWACHRSNMMLVVCGSANSWMLNNLVNNHGGLYGRTTYEVKLRPFKLEECELFYKSNRVNMSRYDIVQSYMILGGIPYYMRYMKKELSLAQNLDNLFFAEDSKLRGEYDRLFASIFTNPEEMKRIVEILATRHSGFTRQELIGKAKLKDSGAVTKMLNALITSDFIQSYVPFGKSKRDTRYKLCDNFCLFYLKFVQGRTELDPEFWMHNITAPAVNSWRGIAFEEVCFNHVTQIKAALSILGVSSTQSPLIIKGDAENEEAQMDLIILRKDNVASVCEMKFYKTKFSADAAFEDNLLNKRESFRAITKTQKSVHLTLITFTNTPENQYTNEITNFLTINDLIKA